jgi:hypothetical protein
VSVTPTFESEARRQGFELGVVLPNLGEQAPPRALRRIAEGAEELGF